MQTLCTLLQTFDGNGADIMQTSTYVLIRHNVLLESVVIFRAVLWFSQVLRGVKGMDQCWLLPDVLMGREAGRPRAVWQIRSSAISGEGLRCLTG